MILTSLAIVVFTGRDATGRARGALLREAGFGRRPALWATGRIMSR